jgi:excisionase family DNA binding protein
MTAPDLQRIQRAADLVGISRDTIYRAVKRGLVKTVKNGPNMTFVSMANVQEWIRNGGNAGKVE